MEIVKGPTLPILYHNNKYVVVHLHLAWFDAWFDWLSECTYVHNMGCRTHFVQNEWFHPCANDFTPGYTIQHKVGWVAARFLLCASDWTHEYTILHKVSLSYSSHFVKAIGAMGTQFLHKVSSCSSHFVKVVGPVGIQYCTKWIPVVLTLCKWLDTWHVHGVHTMSPN